MSQHAYLPPSGANTWVHCHAAPGMWAQFPERGGDKTEAEEGVAAHWVFGEKFYGRPVLVGHIAPNGVPIDDEMLAGADLYVETVDRVRPDGVALYVEQRIEIPSVHPLNSGTPDTWFVDVAARVIYLFDYKYGHGYVDVFENWQLIDYAIGIIDALGLNGMDDQYWHVEMTIVQPRSYHRDGPVRTWRVKASALRPFMNKLRSAAEAIVGEIQPAATVGDWCKHCSGRHACTALQRVANEAADLSLRSLPDDMTPEARALELHYLRRALKRLEARVSGLADSVQDDLARGEPVPFFGLERKTGRLAWSVPLAEVVALGRVLGVDLAKPAVVTPSQARDVLKKSGIDPALVAGFANNPPGALELVAVDSKTARKVFQNG